MVYVRRIVIPLIVVAAIGVMFWGLNEAGDNSSPEAFVITKPPVKRVIPEPGTLALRQSDIGFVLDPLYVGRLEIDGRAIPDDQIRFQIGVNLYVYTPGPGTETGALAPGKHRATAVFWKKGKPEEQSQVDRFSWTFEVH